MAGKPVTDSSAPPLVVVKHLSREFRGRKRSTSLRLGKIMIDSEFVHRFQDFVNQGKDGVEPLRKLIAENGGTARVAALMVAGLQKINRKTKAQQQSLPGLEFPDWWPHIAWSGYVEMRKAKGTPVTPSITALVVKLVAELKAAGENPAAVLEQSTLKGWTDVYPVKDRDNLPQQQRPALRVVGGGNWDLNNE